MDRGMGGAEGNGKCEHDEEMHGVPGGGVVGKEGQRHVGQEREKHCLDLQPGDHLI